MARSPCTMPGWCRDVTCSGPATPPSRPRPRCSWHWTASTSMAGISVRSPSGSAAVLEEQIADQRLVLPVPRLADDGRDAWAEVERRGLEGYVASSGIAWSSPSAGPDGRARFAWRSLRLADPLAPHGRSVARERRDRPGVV